MRSCHRKYDGVAVYSDYVPRARQSLSLRRFVALLVKAFLTSTDHCEHLLCVEINLANGMVFSVAHIDKMLVFAKDMTQSLWVMKLSLIVTSIH